MACTHQLSQGASVAAGDGELVHTTALKAVRLAAAQPLLARGAQLSVDEDVDIGIRASILGRARGGEEKTSHYISAV